MLAFHDATIKCMLDSTSSKISIEFQKFLTATGKLVIRREKAKSVGCGKFNDQVEKQMLQLVQRIEEYAANPVANAGIESGIGVVLKAVEDEVERLRNAEKSLRNKHNKKIKDGSDVVGDILLGSGMKLSWSDINLNSIGDIIEDDMEYFANTIYQHGWLSFDVVKGQCYPPRGKKNKTHGHLLDQLLSNLTVFAIRRNHSRHVILFDGVKTPDALVLDAFTGKSLALSSEGKAQLDRLVAEGQELEEQTLRDDAEFWERLSNEEFIESIDLERIETNVKQAASTAISSVIKKYPDILAHVTEILREHGAEAAEKKRKDDKTHTIAVGTRRVREMLHSQYDEDVSHVTIRRFFKCARVTDRRSLMEGGETPIPGDVYNHRQKFAICKSSCARPMVCIADSRCA